MTLLKDFLASQENRLRAEQLAQAQARAKWISAVKSLLSRIAGWIKESDPHDLVTLDDSPYRMGDVDELGSLSQPETRERLQISLGERDIRIRPTAREGLGPRWKPGEGKWAGQVDMSGEGSGYELLFFTHDDGREDWYLRNSQNYLMEPLNQDSFDAALVQLLS